MKTTTGTVFLIALLSLALIGGVNAASNLTVGLYSYWTADSTLYDNVSGNTSTKGAGVTYVAGKIGNGWSFSSDEVYATSHIPNKAAGTLSLWINPSSTSGMRTIVADSGYGAFLPFSSQSGTGKYGVDFYDSGGKKSIASTVAMGTGSWHMYTLTWDSSNIKLYIDGVLNASNVSGALVDNSFALTFGGNALTNTYAGIQDEIGLWSIALTATNITDLYNAGNGLQFNNSCGAVWEGGNGTCPGIPTTYFSITAKNIITGSSISTFNATINGTTYQTTNGTINTAINSSRGDVISITNIVWLYGFGQNATGVNVTNAQQYNLTPYANITASEYYDNTSIIGFTVQFNGTNYTTTGTNLLLPVGAYLYNATATSPTEINIANITNGNGTSALNISMWQVEAYFNGTEIVSGLPVTTFTITDKTTGQSGSSSGPLKLKAGVMNETFSKSSWFSSNQSFTYTAPSNVTSTFTGLYQSLLNISAKNNITSASVSNFTVLIRSGLYSYSTVLSTTTGNITLPWSNDTNINITLVNTTGFAQVSTLANITGTGYINVTLWPYTTNSIFITFYDETSGLNMSGIAVTAGFSSTIFSTNQTTTNGTIYVDLLTPSDYIITYGSQNYSTRLYYYTVTNQSNVHLSLYLRPKAVTTVVQISVVDQSLNKLQNVIVYTEIKNITGTNDYLVEECQTDINGQCLISADVSTTTYKANTTYRFLIYQAGVQIGDSGYTVLASSLLTLTSSVRTNPLQSYFNIPSIVSSGVVFDSALQQFNTSAVDTSGSSRTFCLTDYMKTGAIFTAIQSNCSTGTAVVLTLNRNVSLGDETDAVLTVYVPEVSSDPYVLSQIGVPNPTYGGAQSAYFIVFLVLGVGFTLIVGMRFNIKAGLATAFAFLVLLFEVTSSIMVRLMLIGLGVLLLVVFFVITRSEP